MKAKREIPSLSEPFDKPPIQPSSLIPHPSIRHWWDQASETDQDALLANLYLARGMAGVPWVFLPECVQALLLRRVRISLKEEG